MWGSQSGVLLLNILSCHRKLLKSSITKANKLEYLRPLDCQVPFQSRNSRILPTMFTSKTSPGDVATVSKSQMNYSVAEAADKVPGTSEGRAGVI